MKSIELNDRIQLIDDAFYMMNNGRLPISIALGILEYIPSETKYLPWKYTIEHVKTIIAFIEDDSQVYSEFRVSQEPGFSQIPKRRVTLNNRLPSRHI